MSEGRMRFFGLSEDKLYYDESKKRFVSTKDAPAYIERGFKNGHFKDVSLTVVDFCAATSWSIWTRENWIRHQVEVWTVVDQTDELPDKTWDAQIVAPDGWYVL